MTRSRTRGDRFVRGARVLLGIVVVAALVDVAPPSAVAQEDTGELAGYQGRAAASGLHALYNPEGLLPLPPPVDLGSPDALATISSGPATFARASVLDPGDLLAAPDAIIALAAGSSAGIPPYPFRVSAASGVGAPAAESNPAPGLRAVVEVGDGTSLARATMPALEAPAIATVGSMASLATTDTDGTSVTVHARSELSGVNILNLVRIDSVVTDLTATSSGGEPELSGGTTVAGATIMGQSVIIDADGIHASGSPPLLGGILGPLVGSLNDLLRNAGITISLVGPVEVAGGNEGTLATNGLHIGVELSPQTLPALAALVDALPPLENPVPGVPSIEDLLAATQARHLVALELARGSVSLLARTSAPLGDSIDPIPSDGFDVPSTGGSFDLPDPAAPSTPPASGGPVLPTERASLPSAGVGALVLLALLSIPLIGDAIARMCTAVLATDRSTTCTWEDQH